MTVGRDRTCELMLDCLGVSRRHARLSWEKGAFVLEDLGSQNGTLVQGQRIGRQLLERGLRFGIGEYELELIDPPELGTSSTVFLAGPETRAGGYLVDERGVSVELLREVTIGKTAGVDFKARGFGVKPVHVRVWPTGPGAWRLGCFGGARVTVNDKPVSQAELALGDRLRVGRSIFFVVARA
jgi:pSer/pThr/pTyr-binding forkhead associated (FHA) protein